MPEEEGYRPETKGKTAIDSRAIWNAIEKLHAAGDAELAESLKELALDGAISNRLAELAQEGGYEGGLKLAEEASERDGESQ